MSSLQNPPLLQLPSCTKDVCQRSKMVAPIRQSRKHSFFIKLTISQYHDIDISYVDIDIAKNAFSMTSLWPTIPFCPLFCPDNLPFLGGGNSPLHYLGSTHYLQDSLLFWDIGDLLYIVYHLSHPNTIRMCHLLAFLEDI